MTHSAAVLSFVIFCWAAAHGANIGRELQEPLPMHSLAFKGALFVFLANEQRRAATPSGSGCNRILLSAPSLMWTALALTRLLEGFSLGIVRPGQANQHKRRGGRNTADLVTAVATAVLKITSLINSPQFICISVFITCTIPACWHARNVTPDLNCRIFFLWRSSTNHLGRLRRSQEVQFFDMWMF